MGVLQRRHTNGQQTHGKVLNTTHPKRNQTPRSYHLTSDRTVTIKKVRGNKCWQGCGKKGSLVCCWQECKLVQPLWKKSMEVPQKIKNRTNV